MGDEFIVFAPKTTSKKYNVMRFSSGDKADIKKWTKASLSRDLSAKKQYEDDFDFPEFGEGSEFGKRRREEARRLKYGKKKSHFVVENQPWDLTISTLEVPKDDKKNIDVKPKVVTKDFHGKKEGGIGEGSMYFVFTQRPNHSFEAYPVQDWCNFSRKISHRTLTDEEAEAAWDKRDKILNHLNYMARKRLHIEDAADNEEAGPSDGKAVAGSSKAANNPSELQIHDHEEDDVGFISNSDDEDNEKGKTSKKATKKPKAKPKPEELSDSEVEGKEDSDDGENEGAEIAYDTDVSSENEEVEDERVAPKGLDELTESSSSEDEEEKEEQAQKDQAAAKIKVKDEPASSAESDLDDIDSNESYAKSALLQAKKGGKKDGDKDKSRSNAPTVDKKGSSAVKSVAAKIKVEANTAARQSPLATGRKESQAQKRPAEGSPSKNDAKRQKVSNNGAAASSSKDAGSASSTSSITAEDVRRILTHKPITIPKLLKKFRSKSGLNKDEICSHITNILRTMKLHKIKINDKMHLYLKS